MIKRRDLIDPELFGNEAGEDEDPKILASYFVEKDEFEPFHSGRFRFRIVKSKKGVGKSALLARACELKRESQNDEILIYLKGADLAAVQEIQDTSPNGQINGWQQRICTRINGEIGRSLNFAFQDIDLSWSTMEAEQILLRKILSYFQRTYPDDPRFAALDANRNGRAILNLVFTDRFPWGNRAVPPDRPIYILSNGRPRWATHLCKLAAKASYAKGDDRIRINHISESMQKYGEARLNDLYKEHRHQYRDLEALIECFARGSKTYSTNQLLTHLTNRLIRRSGIPEIDGVQKAGGAIDVAHFLYRIGLICGRDERETGGLEFVRYEDRPNLLTTVQNLDDGLVWEVHPSYRKVLRIKDT